MSLTWRTMLVIMLCITGVIGPIGLLFGRWEPLLGGLIATVLSVSLWAFLDHWINA